MPMGKGMVQKDPRHLKKKQKKKEEVIWLKQ